MRISCSYCHKFVRKKAANVSLHRYHFCDRKCHALWQVKAKEYRCFLCRKSFTRTPSEVRWNKVFCSRHCATIYNNKVIRTGANHPNWNGGKGSYRSRALRYYGKKCMGITCPFLRSRMKVPEFMLDVDHINCDRSDNRMKNLQVLCAWCHTKKTRLFQVLGNG